MTHIPSNLFRSAVAVSAVAAVGAVAAPSAGAQAATSTGGVALSTASEASANRSATTKRSAATIRKAAATRRSKNSAPRSQRGRALTQVSVAGALKRVTPYTGPTGAIVYSRTVTVPLGTGQAPAHHAFSERWQEIGGGHRGHYVSGTIDASTGAQLTRLEGWTSPQLSIVRPGTGRATVAISCSPNVVPDPDIQLRADRAALATLPEGPAIDGIPTRVGVHVAGTSEVRNYLDAATGQPIRSTQNGPGSAAPQFQTTYLAWEERPAGGSASDLTTTVPADAKLPAAADAQGCLR